MPDTGNPPDWAKNAVLFLLGLVMIWEGIEFFWERLPQVVQVASKTMLTWLVVNEPARYMLLGVVLALGFAVGLALIWRFLLR
jgi:hypothetical protein